MNPSARRPPAVLEGFTLIEMVVVLFILGVVISMAAVLTRGVTAAQQRSITTTRLAAIDAALVQFVQQQKRLPCPAVGTRPSTATTTPIPGDEYNRAATGCQATAGAYETDGVVPWRMLGLSETDITDGWGRRITYRIDPALAADGAMDMSWCDAAGSGPAVLVNGINTCNSAVGAGACTSTPTSGLANCTPPNTFLGSKGLRVKNLSGTIIMDPAPATGPTTGAAYVLISAGQTGGGAYLNTGVLAGSTVADGTEEQKNYASLPYVSLAATYYVEDITNDASGGSHFDDLLLHPSVMNVISRAGLGPRTH